MQPAPVSANTSAKLIGKNGRAVIDTAPRRSKACFLASWYEYNGEF